MKPDPLKLLKREFFSGPVGHVEKRSQSASPANRHPTPDAVLLVETMEAAGCPFTYDELLEAGTALRFSTQRTSAAILSAQRAQLFEFDDD
jgi:hypothetical protein